MLFQPWARRLLARTLLIPVISHNDQKRPDIPPLQGEGDHEVVEGCHPIERKHPSVWPTAIHLPLQGRMIGNDQLLLLEANLSLPDSGHTSHML